MTQLRILAVGLACWMTAGLASAAQPNHEVSPATLAAMGLGGMQPLAERDAQAVRGEGSIAIAWGTGYFKVGNHFAAGSNLHVSGITFSAGGSFAFAK